LPLLLLALVAALVLPGTGWLFVGVIKVILLFWLVACVVTIIMAARFGRMARRHWHGHGYYHHGHHDHEDWPGWRGHGRSRYPR
jgi:hypothetical protein